jgi:hypothetical protein
MTKLNKVTIAFQNSDNTIKEVYVHTNGRFLLNNYNTPELVSTLIDGGTIYELAVAELTTIYAENPQISVYNNMDNYLEDMNRETFNFLWTEFDDNNGDRKEGWMVMSYDDEEFKELK